MISSTILAVAALAAAIVVTSVASEAADGVIRGRFTYDAIATCQQPSVQNFPIHVDGTASLSTDRAANLDMSSNVAAPENIRTTLGKRTDTPGGSTTLKVVGRHTLRAIREYPNNVFVATMTIIGNSCKLSMQNHLKPGKRVYSFNDASGGVAYCSRVQIVRTECTAY